MIRGAALLENAAALRVQWFQGLCDELAWAYVTLTSLHRSSTRDSDGWQTEVSHGRHVLHSFNRIFPQSESKEETAIRRSIHLHKRMDQIKINQMPTLILLQYHCTFS